MNTIKVNSRVEPDGTLRIEVPSELPPGPVEVVLVIHPLVERARLDWRDLEGVGKEIWEGIDAQDYVNQLRGEWNR